MRLDQYLVSQKLTSTRSKAQDAIQEGRVKVNEQCVYKNSFLVMEKDIVHLQEPSLALASRAGFKLYDVLQEFKIDLKERICLDVGASTGGFSDVCLKQGASLVYAVDVGKDQLVQELKENPRIKNMEGINCRYLKKELFDPLPNFACMDVSFISIKLILPVVLEVLENKEVVVLIKPQFEAGRKYLNKHGVITNSKVHETVLKNMIDFVQSLGYFVHHLQASSLLGRDGNKEFVMHIKETPCTTQFAIKSIVSDYSRR